MVIWVIHVIWVKLIPDQEKNQVVRVDPFFTHTLIIQNHIQKFGLDSDSNRRIGCILPGLSGLVEIILDLNVLPFLKFFNS